MHFRNDFFPTSKLVILLANWFYIMRGFQNNSAFLIQVFFFFLSFSVLRKTREGTIVFVPFLSSVVRCFHIIFYLALFLALKIFYKSLKQKTWSHSFMTFFFFFSFHFPAYGLLSLGSLSLSLTLYLSVRLCWKQVLGFITFRNSGHYSKHNLKTQMWI